MRNFGLVWVSGRATDELAAALRARELWEKLGAEIPGVGFRPAGSLTLLRTEREVAVADEVVARADADCRGFALLDADRVRALNPALRGKYLAGLHCSRRRRRRVETSAARNARVHGRHRAIRLSSTHRGAVGRRADRASTTAVIATTATWFWCAPARRTAAWFASSQATCRYAACGCR